MEYYERIIELLEVVTKEGKHNDEYSELEKYVKEESGKEIYLIFAEFLSSNVDLKFDGFMKILPLLSVLFIKLTRANKFVTNEYIEHLYKITSNYEEEKNQQIFEFLVKSEQFKDATQPFITFLILTASDVPEEIAKMMKKPEDSFTELPDEIKIAASRAAVYNQEEMKGYSVETMTMFLIGQARVKYQESGIKLAGKLGSSSSPVKLFNSIVEITPYLSSHEAAINAWKIAQAIHRKMGDEDKFHSIRIGLCDSKLADTARAALIAELQRDINASKGGILRSPLVGGIINVIVSGDLVANPCGKIENFLTAINFMQFLVSLDRKFRCFQIMGTEKHEFLRQIIEKSKKSIAKAKKENNEPMEEIMKKLKKSNFGEKMTEEDVKKGIETSNINIKRAEFALSSLEEILEA